MKILYTNAKIFTSDEKIPWAKEMLVNDEVIEYIGEVRNHTKCDEIIDCGGKMILPGFIDSHCHLQMIAESSWHIILPPFDKVEDILAFVKDYADKHSKEEVPFLYFDYYMTELFDKNGPTKEMLDEIVSDRPVCLTDFTEHMNWVNSKMLELMEVDKNTPDPDNLHVFWRDKQGNPTGWIKERAWEPHIGKLYENIGWWPPSPTNKEVQLNMFSKMIDYGYQAGFNAFMIGEEDMSSVYELDKEEKLNFYYDVSYRCDDLNKLSDAIELVKELNRKYQSKHQKINTIKLFMDGTMASGNVALLEPLCNDPGNYGVAALDENEIELYLHTCNEADIDVHIHVLGDRTFRMICNAVENLKAELGDRWRIQVVIAHACLVAKEDRKRPAELGISINATPH